MIISVAESELFIIRMDFFPNFLEMTEVKWCTSHIIQLVQSQSISVGRCILAGIDLQLMMQCIIALIQVKVAVLRKGQQSILVSCSVTAD